MCRAYLLIFTVLFASCDSPEPVQIVDDATLSEWGYKTTGLESQDQTKWSRENFGKSTITTQSIKSTQLKNGYYPRYSLHKESYQSVDEAELRLSRIKILDPTLPGEYQKSADWNTGFVVDTSVIFVSTDADVFGYKAIADLKEQLEDHYKQNPTK